MLLTMPCITDTIDPFTSSRRYTRGSARGVQYALRRFAVATANPRVTDLTPAHILTWWATISDLSDSTAQKRYSTVRCWMTWARTMGYLDGDPLAIIPPPSVPRRAPVVFSPAELARLTAACTTPRERLILALMLHLGLRCVEVSRLTIEDIDGDLLHIHGKGGHTDVLPLPATVAAAVDTYLSQHPTDTGVVIRDARWHRNPVTAAQVSQIMADLTAKAGLRRGRYDGRGAHALRRTCATGLLDRGASIRQVQAVLRHTSMTSTQHYLRRADAEELRDLLDAPA